MKLQQKAFKPDNRQPVGAGLFRRLAATAYDWFLLLAVLFLATALLLPFNAGKAFTSQQFYYSIYLFIISFVFYGWFWTHGGQTLGLRAWNLKLQSFDQHSITWRAAFIRFIGALLAWSCLGLGFLWLLVDRNRYTWYDRWSGSSLYLQDDKPKLSQ